MCFADFFGVLTNLRSQDKAETKCIIFTAFYYKTSISRINLYFMLVINKNIVEQIYLGIKSVFLAPIYWKDSLTIIRNSIL